MAEQPTARAKRDVDLAAARLQLFANPRVSDFYVERVREIEKTYQQELKKANMSAPWNPIETAPKDGRKVDLWVLNIDGEGYRVPDCRWHKAQECWKTRHYNGAGFNELGKREPTHWMEIVAGPK